MEDISKLIFLCIAGALGTVARYFLTGAVSQTLGSRFPYGTLVVNLTGCFLIGFIAAIAEKKFLMLPNMRLFLFIGFLGAFTTFSTFIFETDNLLKGGQTLTAIGNILLSVAIGLIIFKLGVVLGKII